MPRKPLPRTEQEIADDRRALQDVRGLLAGGGRPALQVGGRKMLHFILGGPEGCDATLSSDGFEIRFGWNYGPHRYISSVAAETIGQLLTWGGISHVEGSTATLIRDAFSMRLMPNWKGGRQLWIASEEDEVRFSVRAGEGDPAGHPWPAPIDPPPHLLQPYQDLSPPLPCPHCGAQVVRARDIGDALVCPHCARSFEMP